MPNTNNYAQRWEQELLEINIQNALTSPFFTSNVKYLGAKTIHFTAMSTSGYRNHTRGGQIQRGVYTQADKPYYLAHDRAVEFLVDKADVDETNATASIENIAKVFEKTQAVPEVDARFYEQVSTSALAVNGLHSTTALNTYTKDNVLEKLKGYISKVKRYRGSLVAYVRSEIMDLVELALADKGKVEWTSVSGLPFSIETRVAMLDGVPLMEVIDDEGFGTKITYADTESGGFSIDSVSGKAINVLVASTEMVKSVKKIESIYVFAPGEHTQGDGWLYQNRSLFDTFVFPNGKNGVVDCVYVDHQ